MSMWISIDLVIKYMLMTMDMIIVDYKTKIRKYVLFQIGYNQFTILDVTLLYDSSVNSIVLL